MEDDSSSDVIAMDSDDSDTSSTTTVLVPLMDVADQPLMQFFKRLIYNKYNQNTMLTNAQLEDILDKEFKYNLLSLHMLEVDIYVTVLKKFLKEWPMWDEFETIAKGLPKKYEPTPFVSVLDNKYKNLKNYLNARLEMAKELSADLIASVKESEKRKLKILSNNYSSDPSRVVLEIIATRDQLNKLIYRQPHGRFNYTIFNARYNTPSQIRMNTLSLNAILNWWSIRITVNLQNSNVFVTRETTHELQHLVVNRRGRGADSSAYPAVKLNNRLQIKDMKRAKPIPTKQIRTYLTLLSTTHDAEMEGMETILRCVRKEFDDIKEPTLASSAEYRRYLNNFPYVRYLYTDVENGNESDRANYDIQLKETILPRHHISVGRLDLGDKRLPPQWLKVECLTCNVMCSGVDLATQLRQHFDEYHDTERDWQCTNCRRSFPMAKLAENFWTHYCADELLGDDS